MRNTVVSLLLILGAPLAFAQHGGGGGHAAVGAHVAGARAGPVRPGGLGYPRGAVGVGIYRGRGRGFGYGPGNIWPYYPIWDYSSVTPLDYGDEFSSEYPEQYPPPPFYEMQSPAAGRQEQAPRIASSVIHDYNFPKQAGATGSKTEFTIVLKDGSMRSAMATWVAGGQLHYIDPDSRQEVLAPALIDRRATEGANAAKNLSLMLPPG